MKRPLLCFLFLLCVYTVLGQDYQCVLPSSKPYFINGKNYMRRIAIDSVKTIGATTVLYPFHTVRGAYRGPLISTDLNGGSWLGKTITILPNRTHLFDNYWGDTVVVKAGANLNDSWIFYNDTTANYYVATVIGLDTMTISGNIDSVKTINLTAMQGATVQTSDVFNNAQIILSQHNGFVQVCDLYMFPLHEPNKPYDVGFDYYTSVSVSGDIMPLNNNSQSLMQSDVLFRLTEFHNPDALEIYDLQVGDVFEVFNSIPAIDSRQLEVVQQKNTISSTHIQYIKTGWRETATYNQNNSIHDVTQPFTEAADYFSQKLADTTQIPEKSGQQSIFFYNPADTSFCFTGLLYGWLAERRGAIEPCNNGKIYKAGAGALQTSSCSSFSPPNYSERDIFYVKKMSGNGCGNYWPLDIRKIGEDQKIVISPNPASEVITLTFPENVKYNIQFINMMGQIVKYFLSTRQSETISVSELASGMYDVKISDKAGAVTHEKVLIQH